MDKMIEKHQNFEKLVNSHEERFKALERLTAVKISIMSVLERDLKNNCQAIELRLLSFLTSLTFFPDFEYLLIFSSV